MKGKDREPVSRSADFISVDLYTPYTAVNQYKTVINPKY